MFGIALAMFAVTALGGITAATLHLRGTPPPAWVGRIHGTAALASIIVLAIGVGQNFDDWTQAGFAAGALALFFATAVMGRVLFSIHLRKGTIPRGLIGMHAAAAVTSVGLLVLEIVR